MRLALKTLPTCERFSNNAAVWPGVAAALADGRRHGRRYAYSGAEFVEALQKKSRGISVYLHYVYKK